MSGPLFYHASMATQPYTTTPPPEISLGGIITSNKAGPKKKGAPLVDNNDDGSCAYDLESLAIDARGWDDGKEAIEVVLSCLSTTTSITSASKILADALSSNSSTPQLLRE